MASQTSASASRQGLPASRIMIAASSSRRSRISAAARLISRARSKGSKSRQAAKAAAALAIACRASSGSLASLTAGASRQPPPGRRPRSELGQSRGPARSVIGNPSSSPSTAGDRLCRRSLPVGSPCSRKRATFFGPLSLRERARVRAVVVIADGKAAEASPPAATPTAIRRARFLRRSRPAATIGSTCSPAAAAPGRPCRGSFLPAARNSGPARRDGRAHASGLAMP